MTEIGSLTAGADTAVGVKFQRERFTERARGTHGRFGSVLGERPITPRQRLLIIYLGLIVATIILFVFHIMGTAGPGPGGGLREGTATVIEKHVEEGPPARYFLVLRINVPTADDEPVRTLDTLVPTDAASWRRVGPGDELTVSYVLDRRGTRAYVRGLNAPE